MIIKNLMEAFLDWLVGFSEGDGSFIVCKDGRRIFEIWQRISDVQEK